MNRIGDSSDPALPWLSYGDGYVAVRVLARPGSSRRGVLRLEPRGLVVGVNAPPEKGRANAELTDLFAAMLQAPRSAVTIAHGQTGRVKIVRIATHEPEMVMSALSAAAAPHPR